MSTRSEPDYAAALAGELRATLEGEVRFDAGSRALYATDGSNYRQVPIGVVVPKSIDDVVTTIAACRRHGAPVLARGGGTSLCGQCCNVAVVIDFSKYLHHLLSLDPDERQGIVQPGTVLDDLRDAAERHHLTFAPDPSTHTHNTLGGMIGNNSCGAHSLMGGKTDDNIESLEVLTYDGLRLRVGPTGEDELAQIVAAGGRRGEIYAQLEALRDRYADEIRRRFPHIPRRVSGYNLDQLLPENGFNVARALVGSEGTCVTVLEATCRLVPSPPSRSLLVLGYPDVYHAADHVSDVLASEPIALEGIDERLVNDMKAIGLHPAKLALLPPGRGWLLVEFGGDSRDESEGQARKLMETLRELDEPPSMKLFNDPEEESMLWKVRSSGLGATAHIPAQPVTWEGWEDSAVPPEQLGSYLRDLRKLLDSYGYTGDLYGHFGQGCVHTRINFDLETRHGIEQFRAFLEEASGLVLGYGGSLSGEHGDGQSKAEFLEKMFGQELVQAFRDFKAIWDPQGKMNPGKVIDAFSPTENLRIGTRYAPPLAETRFRYPDDSGNFARATLRCVGVGECRRHDSGTMCPSYMVTREEKHSTRGRARLLFEVLKGEVITDGWRSAELREALDLCLACKGCKGDCPVSVDMATYKAEFMARYYHRRLRPRTAYAMALIWWWARAGSHLPRAANFLAQKAPFSTLVKKLGGIAPERTMPTFARPTLREWFEGREPQIGNSRHRDKVILWPDTFSNYFLPDAGKAAVEVLEAIGYRVAMPERPLCCGRPLYDWGMLDQAVRQWQDILEVLRKDIRDGVAVIGLEPACVAAFRDELRNLFYGDEDAKRLSRQTVTLAEFLVSVDYRPPELARKAVVHGHCQHKAIMGMNADREIYRRLGLDYELLDSGCCGLAGSFGFEREKYALSLEIGERVLFPAVREAPEDALLLADGFSCREQVMHATGRQPLHIAQALRMALAQDMPRPAAAAAAGQ